MNPLPITVLYDQTSALRYCLYEMKMHMLRLRFPARLTQPDLLKHRLGSGEFRRAFDTFDVVDPIDTGSR